MNQFDRPPSITVVKAIQKAEREKVLDELERRIIDNVHSPITWISFKKLSKIIAELRQAGEQ